MTGQQKSIGEMLLPGFEERVSKHVAQLRKDGISQPMAFAMAMTGEALKVIEEQKSRIDELERRINQLGSQA